MTDHWSRYFSLKTISGLKAFLEDLDLSNPSAAALSYYAETWFNSFANAESEEFNPKEYLSEDLSAVMFGKCPVIFMGTNQWAEKIYRDVSEHEASISKLISNFKRLREIYKSQRIVVAIVPEKDYAMNHMFIGSRRYQKIEAAIESAQHEIAKFDIDLIFNSHLRGLNNYMQLGDFEYPDSHLTGQNYIQLFYGIINAFRIDRKELDEQLSMKKVDVYGDLHERLPNSFSKPGHEYSPDYPNARIELTDGFKTFGSPLGTTWQQIVNKNTIAEDEILILGDSHSSILDQRRLTYLASGIFRRTDFYWNPCGVRTEAPETTATYVLLEISCRFVV